MLSVSTARVIIEYLSCILYAYVSLFSLVCLAITSSNSPSLSGNILFRNPEKMETKKPNRPNFHLFRV